MGDARALEAAGRYPEAYAAYRACAAAEPSADSRYCTSRAAVLAPQRADGFAGWRVLAGVRRDFRALGPEESARRVRAALDADPTGPAAPELRAWLLAQNPTVHGTGRAKAALGGVLLLLGVAHLAGAALTGHRPPRDLRTAMAVGWLLLAAVPATIAGFWGAPDWPWLLLTGTLGIAGVGASTSSRPVLAGIGTAALVTFGALLAGWLDPALGRA